MPQKWYSNLIINLILNYTSFNILIQYYNQYNNVIKYGTKTE